jgi:hypothetical protein
MRARNLALAAGVLAGLATPAFAADRLAELLKGKTAASPRRCIFPDRTVQAEIIDGRAIVYRDARYTYVGRLKGGCPALREDRRIVTRSTGGQLCENDAVRVVETTGHDFGFCTFDKFVPYRRAR